VDVALGASELLPMAAILIFMLYQLAGFGTLHFVLPKAGNWILNAAIFGLIIAGYIANREEAYHWERRSAGALVILMALTTIYAILKLKRMQIAYDAQVPLKSPK
jgi:hypothetical protein